MAGECPGTLDISAAGLDVNTETKDDEDVYGIGDISFRPYTPAGYGAAIDFGASYKVLPGLQASLAVNDLKFRRRKPQGTTRMLCASLLAGAEYNLWQHKVGFGLLYTARFWEFQTLHRITGSVNYRPVS